MRTAVLLSVAILGLSLGVAGASAVPLVNPELPRAPTGLPDTSLPPRSFLFGGVISRIDRLGGFIEVTGEDPYDISSRIVIHALLDPRALIDNVNSLNDLKNGDVVGLSVARADGPLVAQRLIRAKIFK